MQYELGVVLSQVPPDISVRWGWFLILGALLILLAAIACLRLSQSKAHSVYFLGWLLVVACAIEVIITYVTGQWVGLYLHLVAAILFGVTGYMLLRQSSAETITTIIAMYFVVSGIFNIVSPLVMNLPDRGWHVWSGFITLTLGPVVLSNSPLTRTRSTVEFTSQNLVGARLELAFHGCDRATPVWPWIGRTTISAFRAQRPSIGRRGNFTIVKELAAGERFERPYPDSKSRVLPLDDPASRFQWYRFHAPHTQHRRFIEVVAQVFAIRASTVG